MSEPRRVRFEIEWVAPDGSYLIARQLGPGDFSWPPGTRLGGREVRGVTIPRALDRSGRPRLDLFAFRMATKGLAAGQVVELKRP